MSWSDLSPKTKVHCDHGANYGLSVQQSLFHADLLNQSYPYCYLPVINAGRVEVNYPHTTGNQPLSFPGNSSLVFVATVGVEISLRVEH